MQRFIPALLTLLLFGGCHEIYSQFCGDTKARVHCLRADDPLSLAVLQKDFPDYIDDQCPYLFTLQHIDNVTCNNPAVKSVGSDFDGYVRITVFEKEGCYWRAQQDFKAEPWERTLSHLLTRMRQDLLASPAPAP